MDWLIVDYRLIIAGIFVLAALIQLIYYFFLYGKFSFRKLKERRKKIKDPVSVIICARNEAENLDKNLEAILTQDYPEYEVVVVNDCSNDNTADVLGKYLKKYSHLRTTDITEDPKFSHSKKLALTVGIKGAKYEHLLFTDADCKPVSKSWIKKMHSRFSDKVNIVLGYGGYIQQPGFLNRYIRYDTVTIAIQYFSFAMARKPYMGVGRNLAYKKSLFFKNKGFANHYHLLSGDDDLFVNENANKENTAVEFSIDSHTLSEPEKKTSAWIRQKSRHFTTGKLYKRKHKFMLGGESLSRFLFYAAFIYLLATDYHIEIVLSIFAVRLITQLIIYKLAITKLNEKNLLLSILFFDVLAMFVNFTLYFWRRKRPKLKKWK